MQELKKRCLRAFVRFKQSAFARKGTLALVALTLAAGDVMAGSKGAAGFTKATQEVSSYQTPVSNLMKAIAAVIVLVGAFNVYFKMQNGDQDVKNILVLQNAFEKTRKQMKVNALSINALCDNLNFQMFAKLTLKKT